MTSREFVYWFQGYLEIAQPSKIEAEQLATIKKHLAMVFAHEIDPSYPQEQQQQLNDAHNSPMPGNSPLFRC